MSWECRYRSGERCNKLATRCDPGMRGCVLHGKVYFPFVPEKNPHNSRTRRRHFKPSDAARISEFLVAHHLPGNRDGNWLPSAWEYAMTHPALERHSLRHMTVWEDGDAVVGFVHYEHRLGEAFFEIHPDYGHLRSEMLDCAEVNLRAADESGHAHLNAYVADFDEDFRAILRSRGYIRVSELDRPLYEYVVKTPLRDITLPEGFALQSLADENDLSKWNRLLWRGFNHPGEPPEEGADQRRRMQSGANYRRDLAIVVKSDGGDYVSFCGAWFVPELQVGVLEPVTTDPDYRRRGLGRAAVLEGIRRCAIEGATVVYVGSDQEFYKRIGFVRRNSAECWRRRFDR